jgi:hypothetical protein
MFNISPAINAHEAYTIYIIKLTIRLSVQKGSLKIWHTLSIVKARGFTATGGKNNIYNKTMRINFVFHLNFIDFIKFH